MAFLLYDAGTQVGVEGVFPCHLQLTITHYTYYYYPVDFRG